MRESAQKLLQSVWEQAADELARLVRAMGIAGSRVEDVLQDVYLAAWRKGPCGAGPPELRRWLFRVTINRCNLEHRHRTRWRDVLRRVARLWGGPDRRTPAAERADSAATESEGRELVRRALARLQPQLRSVLVLRYFAELDSREIGEILQLPDSTVRSQLRAARKRLAAELKQIGYEYD